MLRTVFKLAVITAAFVAVTGCASPHCANSSEYLIEAFDDAGPQSRSLCDADWGDKVAVVPARSSQKNDSTFQAIKGSLENVLAAAHMESVAAGSGEKYRMSVDWSVKPSRIIRRTEQVPVTVMGGGFRLGTFPSRLARRSLLRSRKWPLSRAFIPSSFICANSI